jgi:hypothetical protein
MSDSDATKARQFDEAMVEQCLLMLQVASYAALNEVRMVQNHGGLATAKHLFNLLEVSEGFTELYERHRLDLSIEAMVVEDRNWHSLFEHEELVVAHRRLVNYRYEPAAMETMHDNAKRHRF